MPHYKNGSPAQLGDLVIIEPVNSIAVIGILHGITPGTDTCNGSLVTLARKPVGGLWYKVDGCNYVESVTLKDAMPLASDLVATG